MLILVLAWFDDSLFFMLYTFSQAFTTGVLPRSFLRLVLPVYVVQNNQDRHFFSKILDNWTRYFRSSRRLFQKMCSKKFCKFNRKTSVSESFKKESNTSVYLRILRSFLKQLNLELWNYIHTSLTECTY